MEVSIRVTTPEERETHLRESPASTTVEYNGHVYETGITLFQFLGYFPGMGVITGLIRLIGGICMVCIRPEWAVSQIIRGTVEICCLGIIYLPFDAGCFKVEVVKYQS